MKQAAGPELLGWFMGEDCEKSELWRETPGGIKHILISFSSQNQASQLEKKRPSKGCDRLAAPP